MSETGHAKNTANFETLLLALVALGAEYNPSQPLILLTALQAVLAAAKAALSSAAQTDSAKKLAVDARDGEYQGIGKYANDIGRAAAVHINDPAFNADVLSVTRLLNGKRAGDAPVDDPNTPDIDESQNRHSVSHLSYDNLEANFGKLITLLKTKGSYKPNEPEFQIAALEAKHAAMKAANNAAKAAYIADDNAREIRDQILYDPATGILNLVGLIKTYIEYRFGRQSAIYKQINALKFKRVK